MLLSLLIHGLQVPASSAVPLAAPAIEVYSGDDEAYINWLTVTNADQYEIQRSPNGTSWSLIYTAASNEIAYTDFPISKGTNYWYRMRSVGDNVSYLTSPWSGAVQIRTSNDILATPEVSIAKGATLGDVVISWLAVANATGYQVEVTINGEPYEYESWVDTPGTSHTVTGLGVDDRITARVYASSADYVQWADSAYGYSPELRITDTANSQLQAPVLTAVTASSSQINLSWTDPNSNPNETGFEVQQSNDGVSGWKFTNNRPADSTGVVRGSLPSGTTYYYRVRAKGDGGALLDSAWSNIASATTTGAAATLETPTLSLGTVGSDSAVLNWTNIANEIGYIIDRSADGTTWAELVRVGADVLTYTNTLLSPETTYHYRVRGDGDDVNYLNSPWSNVVIATTSASTGGGTVSSVYLTAVGTGVLSITSSDGGVNNNAVKTSGTSFNVVAQERAADAVGGGAGCWYEWELPNIDTAANGLGMEVGVTEAGNTSERPAGYYLRFDSPKFTQIKVCYRATDGATDSLSADVGDYASGQRWGMWYEPGYMEWYYWDTATSDWVFVTSRTGFTVTSAVFACCMARQGNPPSQILKVRKEV